MEGRGGDGWDTKREERERQALRKRYRQRKGRRKEEVTGCVGFPLPAEFCHLHLNFGDRTLPIFTVFNNKVQGEFIVVHRSTAALISKR